MTNTLDTLRQIKAGFWALEPHYALGLQDTVVKIMSKQPVATHQKDAIEARHYLIDENGNKYSSKQVNEIPQGSIGIIHINGPMIKYGNWYCWGADELVAQAEAFDRNPNVIGQIWVNDSGGGGVNAVAPYLNFLLKKKKPVLSLCDVPASANYWVVSGSDYIMAENNISASFGSIGIMASLRNMEKYWKNLGIVDHTVYADQSDHKNKAFDLALEGKFKLIRKEHLNPLAINFQNTIKTNRPNLKLDVEGIISGKMFYAEESVEIGLIDSIGNMELAIEKLTELAEVQQIMSN